MGYHGKLEYKLLAQSLRKKGLSYNEILQHMSISKDTLSRWCRNIELNDEQKMRLLKNKTLGQRKGSLIAAENKRFERMQKIEKINEQARITIGNLDDRDKLLLGIALYAAEGDKMDGKGGFSNADPNLISFMVDWFINYAKIPRDKLRGAIWIHEGLSEIAARYYWSNVTAIPLTQFRKTYIVKNKVNSKKIRKNIHQYGVFAVRFSQSDLHRQIMGWIYAVFGAKISRHSAIAQR